jgi:hypothetical protein
MKKLVLIPILLMIIGLIITPISVQGESVPSWIKSIAKLWVEGKISDDDYVRAMQYMVDNGFLKIQQKSISNTNTNKKTSSMSEYCQALNDWNNKYQGTSWLTAETKKEFSKLCTLQISSASKTSLTGSKLFSLLPQKEDLSSEWEIIKSTEYSKPTKTFYYENAGQTKYDKNVNTIKGYRMNIFLFSSESLAKEKFEEKTHALKELIGYFVGSEYTLFNPEQLIMDTKDCTAIFKHTDYTQSFENVYGYCLVGKFIIYQDITGYYPNIHDDFINMMNIAKTKAASKP